MRSILGRSRAAPPCLVFAAVVTLAGCGNTPPSVSSTSTASLESGVPTTTVAPNATRSEPAATAGAASSTPSRSRLVVAPLPWRLDVGLSRAIAFAVDGSIVIVGGLTAAGTTGVVRQIDPTTGLVESTGRLRQAVHDASGAMIDGELLVFGGGGTVAVAVVQAARPGMAGVVIGNLPAARADQATAVVGGHVYVIGGGSAGATDSRIWETADGTSAHFVGRLKIGVRYAAVAVSGTSIYVFGGAANAGDRSDIQRFDTTTGLTTVVGQLPVHLSHASGMTLGGQMLVLGGTSGTAIWTYHPQDSTVIQVGRLPYKTSDAAAVVVGDRGYLIGGEGPGFLDTAISVDNR